MNGLRAFLFPLPLSRRWRRGRAEGDARGKHRLEDEEGRKTEESFLPTSSSSSIVGPKWLWKKGEDEGGGEFWKRRMKAGGRN